MNDKNNNISQFDELFKKGLENHSVQAPSGVFEAVSAATSASAAGAKAVVAKWILGSLVAVSAAVGGYYAFKADDKPKGNKSLVAEMEKSKGSSTDIITNTETINSTENTEAEVQAAGDNQTLEAAITMDDPPKVVLNNTRPQLFIPDSVQCTNVSNFFENDGAAKDQAKTIGAYHDNYSISLKGNICNGSTFNMNLNTSKKVEWFVNDEKLDAQTASLSYQFLEKKNYKVVAYLDGQKVADTLIDMSAPNAIIEQQELGSDAAMLSAKTSDIKKAEWMYKGKVLSNDRQFAFDKRLYTTSPYLITTDKNGCKDTFRAKVAQQAPHFKFVQDVITPNGDGKNDDYEVDIAGYESFVMIISDVYGKTVFTSNTPDVHWNGKDQITQLPCKEGSYAVYISYKLKDSLKTEKKYGKVTLTK